MNVIIFRQRFDNALIELLSLTASFCSNRLSNQMLFIIEPSGWDIHEGLDAIEAERVGLFCEWSGKSLTQDEVIQLLYHEGKVPLWINVSVRKATPHITFCHLLCSRRLRLDEELYHQSVQYPPFNTFVPIPSTYHSKGPEKFDINWQIQRSKGIFDKLKDIFYRPLLIN